MPSLILFIAVLVILFYAPAYIAGGIGLVFCAIALLCELWLAWQLRGFLVRHAAHVLALIMSIAGPLILPQTLTEVGLGKSATALNVVFAIGGIISCVSLWTAFMVERPAADI